MPTYDYRCDACGHTFEQFQSIKAAALRKCPSCGKLKLKRLIGRGGAVLFKGGGFYETDYRSESYKKAAENDKPAEKKSDSKTATKADAKPDSKTEKKPAKKKAAKA
ncbi:MAG: zinc ribbon domain-containing protein [Planctomycetota bacterium]